MKEYSKGEQNIITDEYQVIRLSEGCPWKCPWCREYKEIGDKLEFRSYSNVILLRQIKYEKEMAIKDSGRGF